jgi:hypothetical protein
VDDPISLSSPHDAHPLPARVILSSPGVLSEQDGRLLLDLLSDCGASPRVETIPARRGDTAALTWIVLAVLPLQAFLSALGSKLAEDTYARLRSVVWHLASGHHAHQAAPQNVHAAGPCPSPLILLDPDSGLEIVLEAGLPGEAYNELAALDLSQFSIGPLHYDLARHCWRSELDEATARRPPSGAGGKESGRDPV